MNPKIAVFDLDGTLAESKQPLGEDMGVLVGELLRRIPVGVMSGAGFLQCQKQFVAHLPPGTPLERLYLFPTNAAQGFIYKDGSWHTAYDHQFTIEEQGRIMEALEEALLETGLNNAQNRPPEWGPQIEDRGAQITFSGLGQQAPIAAKKQWDPTGTKKEKLRAALAKRLPDFSVAAGGATSVDITRQGITKAYGVQKLADITRTKPIEMLYVGDALQPGGNDAVVKETGIETKSVSGPHETAQIIRDLIQKVAISG